MNILIFTGGKASNKENWEFYLQESCFIIAADSGLDLVDSYSIQPDLIVGDMDSLKNKDLIDQYKNIVECFPTEKDFSDTEIALQRAKAIEHTRVILIGGGEGRLDHTLSIVSLFENEYAPDIWMTESEIIHNKWGYTKLEVKEGDTISIYGLGNNGSYIDNSKGLQWNLDGMRLNREFMSLSNKAISKNIEIFAGKRENYLLIINKKV